MSLTDHIIRSVPAARMIEMIMPTCRFQIDSVNRVITFTSDCANLRDYPTVTRSVSVGTWSEPVALEDSVDSVLLLSDLLAAGDGAVAVSTRTHVPRDHGWEATQPVAVTIAVTGPDGRERIWEL